MVDKFKENYDFNDNTDIDLESKNDNELFGLENKYFSFIITCLLIVTFVLGFLWYRSLIGKVMLCFGLVFTIFIKMHKKRSLSKHIPFVYLGIIGILTLIIVFGFVDKYRNQLIFRGIYIESKLVIGKKEAVFVGAYNRDTSQENNDYHLKSSDNAIINIVDNEADIMGEGTVTLTVIDNYRNTLSQEFTVKDVKATDYVVENLKLLVGEEVPANVYMFPSDSTDEAPVLEVFEGYEEYLKIENNVYTPLKAGVVKIRAKHSLGDKEYVVKIHADFEEANIKVFTPFETVLNSDGSILHYLANPGDIIRLGIETVPQDIDPYSIEWTITRNGIQSEKILDNNNIVLKFEDHMQVTLNVQNNNAEFILPKSISILSKGAQ